MNNVNINVLNQINKGATMGMEAISQVSKKVKNNNFQEALNIEYTKYKEISKKVNDIYSNYTSNEPEHTSSSSKMMTWFGVQMNTINDSTTSKLAEILIQGTNMGIIEGRKLLNENSNTSLEVKNVLNDFVAMQEDSLEALKKYL